MSQLQPADDSLFFRGAPGDPRLGDRVRAGPVVADGEDSAKDGPVVALLGIADDRGVTNGGGRGGASQGPRELRRWLYKMTTGGEEELAALRLFDLGDAGPGDGVVADDRATVAEVHEQAERAAEAALRAGAIVVLLGGGHDGAYASQSALLAAQDDPATRLWAINVDAHLDVRPLRDGQITSGTPFRRLHERWGRRFGVTEFGIQMQHNSAEHLEWARLRGWPVLELRRLRDEMPAKLRFYKQLAVAAGQGDVLSVSLDLDSVEAASAPGVSAPCPDGFTAGELLALARIAGGHKAVKLLDVMECAPPLDEGGRTARLGAAAVWSFLAGVCADR